MSCRQHQLPGRTTRAAAQGRAGGGGRRLNCGPPTLPSGLSWCSESSISDLQAADLGGSVAGLELVCVLCQADQESCTVRASQISAAGKCYSPAMVKELTPVRLWACARRELYDSRGA